MKASNRLNRTGDELRLSVIQLPKDILDPHLTLDIKVTGTEHFTEQTTKYSSQIQTIDINILYNIFLHEYGLIVVCLQIIVHDQLKL